MTKLFKYPLNIQLFAEGGDGGAEEGTPPASPSTSTVEIDYGKIADVISKRTSATEESALKGYLKTQGLTGEELNQAAELFKQQKAEKENQAALQAQTAMQENAALKAQILNMNIDSKMNELALAQGIDASKVPFLAKLVDKTKLAKEDGSLAEEDVFKTEIENIVKAFPEIKSGGSNGGQNGFQQIGSAGQNGNTSGVDEQLNQIFGIKK
ncbi:hypothetical protein [Thomasclavelia cocleata]|uniref:hypothetical protein n=1 Tax=Thomasclavelia cocleata TaxID=69824 RepID=UPI00272E43DD|nr:hypothetical protein [Thomasclavelia cocleata]